MALTNNPTPLQMMNYLSEMGESSGGGGGGWIDTGVGNPPDIVSVGSPILADQPFNDGDMYLITLYLPDLVNEKDLNFTFIYTVNMMPSYADPNKTEATMFQFKDLNGDDFNVFIYVNISASTIIMDTTQSSLWIVRMGYMPSFAALGRLFPA